MIRRRGSILLAVSLLVVIAALAAAGVLWSVEADGAAERLRRRDDELRALAMDGVRIAMVSLGSQREQVVAGADFEPPSTAVVHEDEDTGRRAVVHFEASGGESDGPERRAVAMAALCPLNDVDAAALVTLGFDEVVADEIVARRPAGGYALPEDAPINPVLPETIVDPNAGATVSPDASPADLLTTTSWDCDRPAATSLPPRRGPHARRLVLGAGLDEQDQAWLVEVLDQPLAQGVAPLARESSWKGRTLGDAAAALLGAGIMPRDVGRALDLLAAEATAFPKGRIDISRAPVRVLMTLPGIDEAIAERLVAARTSLDPAARANIGWPLEQDVLDAARFGAIADRIVVRSLQWRVRIRAEFESAGGSRAAPASDARAAQDRRPSVTLDVVLDAAGDSVRVVSMHETTWAEAARGAEGALRAGQQVASSSPVPTPEPPEGAIQTSSEIDAVVSPPPAQPFIIKDEPAAVGTDQSAASPRERGRRPGGRSGRWRPR